MNRAALIALGIVAPFVMAGQTAVKKQQLPPCMPIDGMRMTNVVHVPQWPNYLLLRKAVDRKYGGKSIVEKLPAPKADPAKVETVKKALPRKSARAKGCKPGRTKNKYGQCGRWK